VGQGRYGGGDPSFQYDAGCGYDEAAATGQNKELSPFYLHRLSRQQRVLRSAGPNACLSFLGPFILPIQSSEAVHGASTADLTLSGAMTRARVAV
jgi:hypothetical protein